MRDSTKRRILTGAAALALVIATIFVWRHYSGADSDAAKAFQTHTVGRGIVERSISASGAVKALVTVDVGSQLSGPITEMKADYNSVVRQGDVLAVIDRAPFEAKVAAAAANLEIAKAEVELREATAAKLQRHLAHYDRDVVRYKALASSSGVSRQQLDQAETQSAVTRQEEAETLAQVRAAKATVALRQADLEQAEINLDRTLIKSPINGVVIDRRMQRGQTVTAEYQTPILFQIAQDLSQILILAQVDEADIGALHVRDKVSFSVDAFPDEAFSGVVEQIRLAASRTSGVVAYTVVVRAQNPDLRLFPDMTATVRITSARRDDVLNVPNEAFRFRPSGDESGSGRDHVWILNRSARLERRNIRPGIRGDTATEVIDGELQAGEAVILRPSPPPASTEGR